jgi:hypothetical protein
VQYTFGNGSWARTERVSWEMWYPWPPWRQRYDNEPAVRIHLSPTDARNVGQTLTSAAAAVGAAVGGVFVAFASLLPMIGSFLTKNPDGSLDILLSEHGLQVGQAPAHDPSAWLDGAWTWVTAALWQLVGPTQPAASVGAGELHLPDPSSSGGALLRSVDLEETMTGSQTGDGASAGMTPTIVVQRIVQQREADGLTDTRIQVQTGDRLVINAYGSIWAGVWLTGSNGPQGWSWIATDPAYPMVGAHVFALLGRLGDYYFEIGQYFETVWQGPPATLFTQTNDNTPGNGSGAFMATVQVWRDTPAQAALSPASWGAATVQLADTEEPDQGGQMVAAAGQAPPGM